MDPELSPANPMRPVDWRWRRAVAAAERGDAPTRRGDAWTARAARFRLELGACRDAYDRAELAERRPALYWAHAVHDPAARDERRSALRDELEAWLLTGAPREKVAPRFAMTADTVEAYARVFFDVEDRLACRAYIVQAVIGPALHRDGPGRDPGVLWKLYGYLGGPVVLDAVASTDPHVPRPTHPDEVDAFFDVDARRSLRRKAAITARSLQVNGFTQADVLMAYARFRELEAASDNPETTRDAFMRNVMAMLSSVPISVGRDPLAPALGAVEYRSDERLRQLGGETIELPDFEIPEPPSRQLAEA